MGCECLSLESLKQVGGKPLGEVWAELLPLCRTRAAEMAL